MPRHLNHFPLYPYSVGRHSQFHYVRQTGFPVDQLFLIRSGIGLFRDLESGSEFTLEPGMAFAFPANRGHEYYPVSHEPWHVAFIGYHGSQAHSVLEGIGLQTLTPFYPGRFEECWNEIGGIWHKVNQQTSNRQDEQTMEDLSVCLYKLFLMLRDTESSMGSTGRLEFENVRNDALQKALDLINQHFTEPLLISNLAGAVGYSVQHFQRLFLQEYGITPHQYLQNLRLQRAMQLISEDTEISVQDIALNLGMETNYFIRVFRKAYGCTPGTMRKRKHEAEGSPNL